MQTVKHLHTEVQCMHGDGPGVGSPKVGTAPLQPREQKQHAGGRQEPVAPRQDIVLVHTGCTLTALMSLRTSTAASRNAMALGSLLE